MVYSWLALSGQHHSFYNGFNSSGATKMLYLTCVDLRVGEKIVFICIRACLYVYHLTPSSFHTESERFILL